MIYITRTALLNYESEKIMLTISPSQEPLISGKITTFDVAFTLILSQTFEGMNFEKEELSKA